MVRSAKCAGGRGLERALGQKAQLLPIMECLCFPAGTKGLLRQKGGDRKEITICPVFTI